MTKKEYVRRYVYFVVGIFILSFGIALSTRADLGVSPVSSIPYALSFSLPFSMGQDHDCDPVDLSYYRIHHFREEKFQSHKHSPDRSRCPVWIF